ncbi:MULTISPECIES: ABC-F family ATP-binding cassette domain-containing protein [Enterococcus]|mgnify:CR=1 FL=1|uniref:ABC-F family ATP-binding cassette domain-containing protein n=1 Tax=Enterococcus TaxID=1350 RepID=UPI0002A393B3|nr:MULTISPECIES: ABC-F family ATP-binding cassette domain-containing protein [Enterococcus]ELB06968.1 ABC transporter ATP-binding protein [Enterococcus faecium EnGen0028]ELB09378.1 ABC transporter ATP-binding protein [Enterococcus faecium EnGen0029]EMF0366013.1 ABC-F family ATP-binding cassette domain-containing protein [Enterococcus faecium]EMF0367528.1 ABC-F family ATP-binding cassette domain-containing protein [Enterococcus faecium]MDB7685592.1 ABC-F family ATP-binding cassette domain-conta
MKELKVTDLKKTYGEKDLFDQISFLIHEKDRIGLIGTNGTGKTSLLNIIAGIDSGDGDRQTVFYPTDYRIGYLSQAAEFSDELTVLQAVFQGNSPLIQTVRAYEEALIELGKNGEDPNVQKRYAKAEEQMNKEDAWTTDTNAKIILQKLGISELDKKINTLSGGQKKRVSLAQVLIDEPDLLLLDEPTNHLDYQAIEWLENYLKQYRGALLMVTHDRYFLDRVANRIFELSFGKLYEYKGNYEAYVLEKAERDRVEVEQEEKRKRLYKQELAWMRAGVQARGTKQQARINRFEDLKENLYQVNQEDDLELNLATQRLGKKVLEIKDGSYRINDQTLLEHLDLLIQSRERLGITGKNGAGKSTLLNILAGRIPLDSGTISIGETVRLAYYTQENEEMAPDKRMIAYLQEAAEEAKTADGSQIGVAELLERFLFPRFMHGTLIGKLSGGEKRRLFLLKLLIQQPNVLLLDEPTNDLDIATLTILEDYFRSFPGAVITVSHDRYFLDKVADKLLVFQENGKQELYYGNMSSYLLKQKELQQPAEKVKPKTQSKEPAGKKKLSYMEQKEWETIEEDIAELEEKISLLQEEMNHQGDDFTRLQELQNDVSETEAQLEEKMARWEYLSEWAED